MVYQGTINRVFRSSFPEFEGSSFRTDAWRYGVAEQPDELRPMHSTLLHAFAISAKLEDKRGITLLPEKPKGKVQTKSYRELYHLARRMSSALHEYGVRPGDRVLLVLPTSLEFVSAFFAIELLKAIPVPAYPPSGLRLQTGLERLSHIAKHAGIRLCVTDTMIRPVMGEVALRAKSLQQVVTIDDIVSGERPDTKFRAYSHEPAFIQYTSGSTGTPKGVLLSHENLVSNIHAIGQALEIRREDVVVSWCPLYHDMGLIGTLLFSIYWRVPLILMSPIAFLSRPSRWLWAIHHYKGTLSPAPNFGYGMCVTRVSDKEREGLDLSSWRLAMNGAEPVNYRTLVDFESMYKPLGFRPEAMLPVYGLAEGTLATTFPRPGSSVRYELVDRQALANGQSVLSSGKGSMAVVSVGRSVPGHHVMVVDENNQPLPEREVGHILVSGPSVMSGYYGDDEATDQVVQNGWLWTGDLGYFADNQLYVTGRAKDLIIIRGRNLYAEDVERCVERVDGVRLGGVVAFGVYDDQQSVERIVVVCETRLTESAELDRLTERIREVVNEFMSVNVSEVVLVKPGTVPKTSSGKRQRSRCRERYRSGKLKQDRTSKASMGLVMARSSAGFLLMRAKKLLRGKQK